VGKRAFNDIQHNRFSLFRHGIGQLTLISAGTKVAVGEFAMPDQKDKQLDRRGFCNRVFLTSAGIVLATRQISGQEPHRGQPLVVYPPMRIEGAERVMPGSALYFNYPKPDDVAVLCRTTDGMFLAFSRKCAHLGCSVDFDESRRCLVCPCHRGVYDARTGYVAYGPPPRPLDQIILQMRAGGQVWAVGTRRGGDFNA